MSSLWISQGSELATNDHFRKGKGIAAEHVDVFMTKRRGPSSIFVRSEEAFGPELIERSVHINGVPEYDDVCYQAESPELIFLSPTVALSQFASLSVENDPGERMAAFAAIKLRLNASPVVFVVNIVKQIQGFDDPPQFLEREGKFGRAVLCLQRAHESRDVDHAQIE